MKSLLLFVLAALAGCASSKYIANAVQQRPSLPEDCPVSILSKAPDGAAEVGVCTSKAPGGGAFFDYSDKALIELKRCACAAGGNAVVLISQDDMGWLGSQQRVRATGSVLWIEPKR